MVSSSSDEGKSALGQAHEAATAAHFLRFHFDLLARRLPDIAIAILLIAVGAVEAWAERTHYSGDAISLLNIRDAFLSGHWRAFFNPYWSAGYPFLLALARPFFSKTPTGDWTSIHVVNLLIFLGAWAAFLFLLRSLPLELDTDPYRGASRKRNFLKIAGLCVFLATELCMDEVSRINPDMLVTLFFFLSLALLLRFIHSPGVGRAILLGWVLGMGFWVKAIWFPLALMMLAVAAIALVRRRYYSRRRSALLAILLALGLFVLVAVPDVVGISRTFGRFTLGDAGPLNYQFNVSLLPRCINWQGGPLAIYGTPIHPTRQLLRNPDLFTFGEPFHATYPPWQNPWYWYEGYHSVWSARLQARAILRNGHYLAKIVLGQPIFYGGAAAWILLWLAIETTKQRREWLRSIARSWPFYVPAAAGIGLYLLVKIEARYISSFCAVLFVLPFAAFAMQKQFPRSRLLSWALAALATGAALNFGVIDGSVFRNLEHHAHYTTDPQWKLGMYLRHAGFRSGDPVAAVGWFNAGCEWAYMDRLRIVAEIGDFPYDQRHPESFSPEFWRATVLKFWKDAPVRKEALADFRSAGAVAVIAPADPTGVSVKGWNSVPGTGVWVYRFSRAHTTASPPIFRWAVPRHTDEIGESAHLARQCAERGDGGAGSAISAALGAAGCSG